MSWSWRSRGSGGSGRSSRTPRPCPVDLGRSTTLARVPDFHERGTATVPGAVPRAASGLVVSRPERVVRLLVGPQPPGFGNPTILDVEDDRLVHVELFALA